ncbi:HPP family protein [Azotobacter vinelandii]|uniref:HPP family protein n=1 Tax=Azotobacter vinelandii TaxID=354 RepID=UPI0007739773|nr:CBS domain-containing protein [Azotobacter vinelandii]
MPDKTFSRLKTLLPALPLAAPREWLRSAAGICLVVAATLAGDLWLFDADLVLHLAPPIAASSVLLLAASSSPFARPWPILAGNLLSASIGILLGSSGLAPVPAAGLGAALALTGMFGLRCLHPPSCALALAVIFNWPELAPQGPAVLLPVAFNSLMLLGLARGFNRLTRPPRDEPPRENPHQTRDPLPTERLEPRRAALDAALEDFGEYLDITREDLERLVRLLERNGFRHSLGQVVAADIMSRDLRWATPDTSFEDAWKLLRDHRLQQLPVIDGASRRLLGIVERGDLLERSRPGFAWPAFGRPARSGIGSAMGAPTVVAHRDTHLAELVLPLSEQGLHCLPVVDDDARLVGLVTQTDLIAALYRLWLKQLPA